jgi:hypothetical protein
MHWTRRRGRQSTSQLQSTGALVNVTVGQTPILRRRELRGQVDWTNGLQSLPQAPLNAMATTQTPTTTPRAR